MTIAIGLLAADGVILCSDSQLTIPEYVKYPGRKVFTLTSAPGSPQRWAVGFTYAGDPERMKSLYEKMQEALYSKESVDQNNVKRSLEQALSEVRGSIIHANEDVDVLCGGSIGEGDPFLFSGKSGVVTESDEFAALGVGDSSLARYLISIFPEGRLLMDFSTGLVAGAYIIARSVDFVDKVSGELQLCLLRQGGRSHMFTGSELVRVKEIAEKMGQVIKKTLVISLGRDFEGIDYEKGQNAMSALATDIYGLRKEIDRLFWGF